MKIMCKTCGKDVDFLRISPEKPVQKTADNLRRNGGIVVEKRQKMPSGTESVNY
jgi:hypothetical protein